jgi:oxalate decarboxylase/phosphoglucose isomerase-like protein (cupin superfamily)
MDVTRQIADEFTDARGGIKKLLDDGNSIIKSTLLISSKAGAIRANHYHKKDSHYVYLLKGKMKYFEREIEGGEIESVTVEAGDMVYTPPMKAHAMKFLEDSDLITLATESRSQEDYEADTIRLSLIEA